MLARGVKIWRRGISVVTSGAYVPSMRAYVFYDGGYVRAGLQRIGVDWRLVNLATMSQLLPQWLGGTWQNHRITPAR